MRVANVRRIVIGVGVWLLALTALQLWLNFDWTAFVNDWRPLEKRKLNVAYIPVT